MSETMLKIDNLVVDYGHVHALRDISLEVDRNEIVCLIGSNGAGKTSTLSAISNIIKKTSGRITFKGQDITDMRAADIVRLGISHVPEGRHVFPKMTVGENLILGTMALRKVSRKFLDERREQMYDLFPRLKERVNQAAGTLSGGEQQMLAIARGLMYDPDLIMLDEPSLGLAPIVVEEIFELICTIQKQGKTVLLIEQNANMALKIADLAYVLETGTITMSGTGAELLADEKVKEAYLGKKRGK